MLSLLTCMDNMPEFTDIKTQIVIVGGGPVGLACACALASQGLETVLVDAGDKVPALESLKQSAGQPTFDSRVSALTVASEAFLNALGVWNAIQDVRVCPYRDMQVWDGEGTGHIHFSAAEIHTPTLGYIVENTLITAALSESAKTLPGLTIIQNAAVTKVLSNGEGTDSDTPAGLILDDGRVIQASLVIGADGGRSVVREQAGFKIHQWDYGHKAIVATVKTAQPHEFTAWQRFMQTGPLAFLPLQIAGESSEAAQYSAIVWSCVTEEADGILALDEAGFRQALGEAFEFRLGAIAEVSPRASFPLWQRHAEVYVQERFVLVGDAAHTVHPLAGQGVNLGFADVQALSEVINQARDRGEDFVSHQVLSRYQRRRKGHNMGMMLAMEGFKRLFASDDLMLRWLRNTGLTLTGNLPLLKQELMRRAMGL